MLQKCKKNVLTQFQAIRNLPKNSSAKASILILDTVTAPVLSEMFTIQQLLQVGVKDLCRIDRVKKPEPTCIGIYYISCKSLQSLFKDFKHQEKVIQKKKKKQVDQSEQRSNNEELQSQYLYMSINLLFCEEASEDILRQIAEHEEIIQRIASFGELYIPCRYSDRNIAIIPFSTQGEKNTETLRRMTKSINNKLFDRNSIQNKKQQQQKQQHNSRKRQRTAHGIHKQNFSCMADVYQFEKGQGKQKKKLEQIQNNIANYGKKLCQAIMGGTNIGLNTVVKLVNYQSKFCGKLKEVFISNFTQCMQAKSKQMMQGKLQEEGQANQFKPSLFAQSTQPEAKQIIVILADRQADNLSPLIRSFYYQPFLMDVFGIKDPPQRKIHIISPKIAPTTVQVDDKIFCQYNNMFINEVFHRINPSLQDYMSRNKAAKFHKDKVNPGKGQQIQMQQKQQHSAKQLKQVIKQLPEYKKTIKSYNTNIQILNVMGNIAKEKRMYQQGQLEHTIITGYGGDKKQVKDKKILENIIIMLQNKEVSVEDKCRLMVLAINCLDIDNSQRNKIITRLSKIQGYGDISMILSKISSKGIRKYPLPISVQKSSKQCYMDRHQCTLSLIIQQLILNNNTPKLPKSFKIEELKPLSVIKKPQIKGSLTKQKPKNTEYIISMCGGLGYNEISDIQRLLQNSNVQNTDVNFVTDYIFTPVKFLEELCTLL